MSPEHIARLELVFEVIGVLAVVATVIVQLTPDPEDDGKVKKVSDAIFKIISYLPTFGINPRTKKMEEALKEKENK